MPSVTVDGRDPLAVTRPCTLRSSVRAPVGADAGRVARLPPHATATSSPRRVCRSATPAPSDHRLRRRRASSEAAKTRRPGSPFPGAARDRRHVLADQADAITESARTEMDDAVEFGLAARPAPNGPAPTTSMRDHGSVRHSTRQGREAAVFRGFPRDRDPRVSGSRSCARRCVMARELPLRRRDGETVRQEIEHDDTVPLLRSEPRASPRTPLREGLRQRSSA